MGEHNDEWLLKLPCYELQDYTLVNRRLLNGELLLNVPATRMVYNHMLRVYQLVINDLNQMI